VWRSWSSPPDFSNSFLFHIHKTAHTDYDKLSRLYACRQSPESTSSQIPRLFTSDSYWLILSSFLLVCSQLVSLIKITYWSLLDNHNCLI
jgi:hypothetical protein